MRSKAHTTEEQQTAPAVRECIPDKGEYFLPVRRILPAGPVPHVSAKRYGSMPYKPFRRILKGKVRVSPHHPAKERSDQLFLSQKVKVSPDADFIQVIYPCRAPASACSHLKSILREHSR